MRAMGLLKKINFRKVLRTVVDVSKVIVTLGLVKKKTAVGQVAEAVVETQQILQEKTQHDSTQQP